MIIVSQNRECIINVDNICIIYKDGTKIVCDDTNGDMLCELGEYITEQECKKIIEKIIYDISLSFVTNKDCVIYMPQRKTNK